MASRNEGLAEKLALFGPECWRHSPLPYVTAHTRVLHNIAHVLFCGNQHVQEKQAIRTGLMPTTHHSGSGSVAVVQEH